MSFERTNLAYVVRRTENKAAELLHILQRMPGSAILYVRNRRRTKEVTEWLQQQGITADFYHAGLDDAVKDIRQQRWQKGESRVMVATNAFGMGIDKPDVRLVIHLDLPDSIEAYFQEAGRAGRDGQKAYAIILYAQSDNTTLRKRIPDNFPEKDYIRDVYEHLQYYYEMAMGDGLGCVREFDIEDFCRKFKYFPVPVDSALKILTQAGYLEYTDEQDNASRLLFSVGREELYRLRELGEDMDRLIQAALRSYTGLFTDYAPRKKTPYIIYTRERVESNRLNIPPAVYEERKARYEQRIKAMLEYVTNDTACRSRMLLHYFGEQNEHDCGQCDTCLRLRHKITTDKQADSLSGRILHCLSGHSLTPAALADQLLVEKDLLAETLRQMMDDKQIFTHNGMLQIRK